jgi:polysaccharide export outer membrane protein
MTRPRTTRLLALLLVVFSITLSAAAQFNGPGSAPGDEINRPTVLTTDNATLYPPTQLSTLRPGDQITIKLYGEPDYSPAARVDTDGNVHLPLIGKVHLAGLSVSAAQDRIAQQLSDAEMFRDPQVTLQVIDGPDQNITVIGEVHGVVPAIGNRHLLEVLAAVGGLPATASHTLTINRPGLAQPIVVDLGNDPMNSQQANIPVFAGDTVVVSRIGVVYVLGAFRSTGAVPLNNYGPLTLTELTSLSGGITALGKYGDLRIVRTVGNKRTVSTVDIKKVLDGKAPDPILEPNDIVYLPSSALKGLFSSQTLGTLLGVVSLALYVTSVH